MADQCVALTRALHKSLLRHMTLAEIQQSLDNGPGPGKSRLLQDLAKERDLKVIDIRLTKMEPVDLKGTPGA